MKPFGLYVLDLDGTVYRGRQPIPHAAPTVAELLRRGSQVRFVTNNSAARPVQVSAMLNHMGVPCKPEWVGTSAQVAAKVCKERGFDEVFLMGEEPFRQTLADEGVAVAKGSANAVVVGICRSISYGLLDEASRLVRSGLPFIASNRDATFPLEGGRLQPGAGSMVAAVEVASGVQAEVVGKPAPQIVRWAMDSSGHSPEETVVVGDRLDTDIEAGRNAGCATFLVLSGVESELPKGQEGGPDLRGLLA